MNTNKPIAEMSNSEIVHAMTQGNITIKQMHAMREELVKRFFDRIKEGER